MDRWESFYVIVGTSGAALIGIQFVVVTLIANLRERPSADAIGAFATPTVVHFAGALLISAIMSAPWPSLYSASFALAMLSVGGLVYGAVVIGRTRRQTGYTPVWEDWLWYTASPCGAYAALLVAALILRARTEAALFVVAAAALSLLFIGVHNAWDSVMHIATGAAEREKTSGQ